MFTSLTPSPVGGNEMVSGVRVVRTRQAGPVALGSSCHCPGRLAAVGIFGS